MAAVARARNNDKPNRTARDFQTQFIESSHALQPTRKCDKSMGMETSDQSIQTVSAKIPKRIPFEHQLGVSRFLRIVEPMVLQQLERNLRSQVEKSFKVEWRSVYQNADLISKLSQKIFVDLPCLATSWNSNGSSLATAFGHTVHNKFCFHKSGICVWRIFLGKAKPEPEHILQLDTCISGIAFHPTKEYLLAAAGANGEIFVWDLKAPESSLIADSGLKTAGGHTEPITSLQWISLSPTSRTFMLLTAGLDGKLIIWGNNASKDKLNFSTIVPNKHAVLLHSSTSVTKDKWTDSSTGSSFLGISSAETSPGSVVCLIGGDTGTVAKCNLKDFKDAKSILIESSVTLEYNHHDGPVTGVARSPFSEQCFATVSSDGKLRLYRDSSVNPIAEATSFHGKPTCCRWSPFRPFIILVGTSTGELLFYDFYEKKHRSKPIKIVSVFQDKEDILSVQFHSKDSSILAVGGTGGVQLWKIPETFSTPVDDETHEFLEFLREGHQ